MGYDIPDDHHQSLPAQPETTLPTLFTINQWRDKFFNNSRDKGFWEGQLETMTREILGLKLALIHSEVSEALEEMREGRMETYLENGKPCGFPSELVDIIIRVFDLCGRLGIDIEGELAMKHGYNITRPHRHGNKAA